MCKCGCYKCATLLPAAAEKRAIQKHAKNDYGAEVAHLDIVLHYYFISLQLVVSCCMYSNVHQVKEGEPPAGASAASVIQFLSSS